MRRRQRALSEPPHPHPFPSRRGAKSLRNRFLLFGKPARVHTFRVDCITCASLDVQPTELVMQGTRLPMTQFDGTRFAKGANLLGISMLGSVHQPPPVTNNVVVFTVPKRTVSDRLIQIISEMSFADWQVLWDA